MNWLEAYATINVPIEVPGVVWGRRLKVEDIAEAECVLHFRFCNVELNELFNLLWGRMTGYLNGNREKIVVEQRYTVPFETGMLVLFYRMAHTTRIRPEMELFFGMRRRHIACILETFSNALYLLALTYLSNPLLLANRFPLYAEKIYEKCGLLDRIWGFIDGTVRQTCRPTYFQKRNYSGHKRYHGLKFQSVMTPDGFFGHFFGPTNGNRHDSFMLGESGIMPILGAYMAGLQAPYALYGDGRFHLFETIVLALEAIKEGINCLIEPFGSTFICAIPVHFFQVHLALKLQFLLTKLKLPLIPLALFGSLQFL